ncbi:hypothetical protein ACRCQS_12775 [Pseudomonas aeruginosa]|uniref:hypothetical protein n=1 Tax=Pseudomonas aeruginosa TaxID=287 RepID=UPI000449697A|nr:hypothetical protein [Pseudomonas aeruginosa]EKU9113033.1 hypothetical protein [Pseudomonas aeruginosa]OWK95966.1 hypothetical protein L999_004105 [Pseudomonas aeruginosa 148]HBO1119995.1 hypothetical protein [Pseudomonas aeruginosa]HDQ4169369.1 hypothetical protein [Pseudomonas aeruginosa]
MTTHHFQLSYSVRPLDQSEAAVRMAEGVSLKMLQTSVEGWGKPDQSASSIAGTLELSEGDIASKRDEALACIKGVFSDVLASNDASFDVAVHIEALVDRLGPALVLEV